MITIGNKQHQERHLRRRGGVSFPQSFPETLTHRDAKTPDSLEPGVSSDLMTVGVTGFEPATFWSRTKIHPKTRNPQVRLLFGHALNMPDFAGECHRDDCNERTATLTRDSTERFAFPFTERIGGRFSTPRCGLLRRSGLKRKKPLPRGPAPQRKKPIRKMSAKARRRQVVRDACRRFVLKRDRYRCRRCRRVLPAYLLEAHDVLPRGRGGDCTDPANNVTLCIPCHRFVTDNPDAAEAEGFMLSRFPGRRRDAGKERAA